MKTNVKLIIAISALVIGSIEAFAQGNPALQNNPTLKADNDNAVAACSAEISASKNPSCAGMRIGTGLKRCLHENHKADKAFKLGDGCKSALKKFRSDRIAIQGGNNAGANALPAGMVPENAAEHK